MAGMCTLPLRRDLDIKAVLFFMMLIFLTGCSDKVQVLQPIDVSLSGQTAAAAFTVREKGGYRVALLFIWSRDAREHELQRKLWGGGMSNSAGVAVPIRLIIHKDGKLYIDQAIVTWGVDGGQAFEYEGVLKSSQVRDVKHMSLSPGDYSIEVVTQDKITALEGQESYVEFSYYNPKI